MFFFLTLHNPWVVNNLKFIVSHMLELLANSKSTPSHVEAVYSRKCVSFVLDSIINSLLGEASQLEIAKILTISVSKQMELLNNEKSESNDIQTSQHIISTALYQLSSVVLRLGKILYILSFLLMHVFSIFKCFDPFFLKRNHFQVSNHTIYIITGTASMSLITDPILANDGKSIMFSETLFSVLLHPSSAARYNEAYFPKLLANLIYFQRSFIIFRSNFSWIYRDPEHHELTSQVDSSMVFEVHC